MVPLHLNSHKLCTEAAEEAIVYVTSNIHSDLFLEIGFMFLSIYSSSLCLGQHSLLQDLHGQFNTLFVLELAHAAFQNYNFILNHIRGSILLISIVMKSAHV